MRILLVEDEVEMAAALASALKRYDMVVDHVPTLAEAEEAIAADVHGAVLLDRRLPDGDGLALIPKLRASSLIGLRASTAARMITWQNPSRSRNCWHGCAPCCGGLPACSRTS